MTGTKALQSVSLDADKTDSRPISTARQDRSGISFASAGRQLVWHTERLGVLAVEAHGVRLVVLKWSGQDEQARFMILRRQFGGGSPLALVASGAAADVKTAMAVAEEQGCRWTGLDPEHFASRAAISL